MRRPRSWPAAKIRGVSFHSASVTPITILLELLDPTTKSGYRGGTVKLTMTDARSLRDSLTRHLAFTEERGSA